MVAVYAVRFPEIVASEVTLRSASVAEPVGNIVPTSVSTGSEEEVASDVPPKLSSKLWIWSDKEVRGEEVELTASAKESVFCLVSASTALFEASLLLVSCVLLLKSAICAELVASNCASL